MSHQIGVLEAGYNCLGRGMRAHIVVLKSESSLVIGFSDFLEDNWPYEWLCTNQNGLLRVVLVVWL